MIERLDRRPARKRVRDATPIEPLPSLNRERNIPRIDDRSHAELVVAATPKGDIPKTILIGTGLVVGAPVAASVAGGVLTMLGVHKVMDKLSSAIGKPLADWIESLGEYNPIKKIWNWCIGKKGGDGGHAEGHEHHGGGHDHGHGHDH